MLQLAGMRETGGPQLEHDAASILSVHPPPFALLAFLHRVGKMPTPSHLHLERKKPPSSHH